MRAAAPVTFQPHPDQAYGFDVPVLDELENTYPLVTVGGDSYRVSWKSLKSHTPDRVLAIDGAEQALTFEQDGTPVMATRENNINPVNLMGSADGATGEVLAKVGEVTAGKLSTITYDVSHIKVKIVPVNRAGGGLTTGVLQEALNKIYAPAVATWGVEVMENQELGDAWDDEGNGLEDGGSGMLSNYTGEMNGLIKAFKDKNGRDKDTYYVFLVGEAENSSKLGYMPRKKQWGFVFTSGRSREELTTTIAHELGHGVYRLEHTFSEKGIPKEQTQNLMDYAGGRELYKYQWDHIHNPASVVTLFDDEEEAAMEGGIIGPWEGNSILSITKNELTEQEIKLTYKVNNWTATVKKLELASDKKSDYQLTLLVEHEAKIVYSHTVELKTSGQISWHGLVFADLDAMTKENYLDFKVHLGILPKEGVDGERFKNWQFSQGGRPESTVLRSSESEGNALTFVDLIPSIDHGLTDAWFDWKTLSNEAKSITSFEEYNLVADLFEKEGSGIGDIFRDEEDPLQFLYDNSTETTFLGVKVRVHWTFAQKLKSIEDRLTDASIKSGRYGRGEIGGIGVRPQYTSSSVSNHSYGVVVDIKPDYNHFLKDDQEELLFFIERVTGLNLFDKSTRNATQITQANARFKNLTSGVNSYGDLVAAYVRIDNYRNQTEPTYDLATLNTVNHISEFEAISARIDIGLIDRNEINLFFSKLRLLNTLVNGTGAASDLSYVIFDDQARQSLSAFAQGVGALTTSLASLENNLTDDQLAALFSRVTAPAEVDVSTISSHMESVIQALKDLGFVSESEIRPFDAFSNALRTRSSQKNFIRHIFSNGFCELPLELIQSFEQEEDVQWGGMWNGTNVDYMHFEIKKAAISKYLKQKKP